MRARAVRSVVRSSARGLSLVAALAGTGGSIALFAAPAGAVTCAPARLNLGSLGGVTESMQGSEGLAVNSSGTVAGWAADSNGEMRAAIWQGGHWRDLGLPHSQFGQNSANAVNASGVAVGQYGYLDTTARAFRWAAGKLTWLAPITASGDAIAYAVNGTGTVAGYATTSTGHQHAVTWSSAGVLRDLGVPAGYTDSVASGINGSGEIAGTVSKGTTSRPAVFYSGGWHLLSIPAGSPSGYARTVDSLGRVAGGYDVVTASGVVHRAAAWIPGVGRRDLGVLPTDNTAITFGADAQSGYAVGASATSTGTRTHAFLTSVTGGTMRTLLPVTGHYGDFAEAEAIAGGYATGMSATSTGVTNGVLWTCAQQQAVAVS